MWPRPSPDPVQPKGEWSFTEGFVVEEGKDLLPPKYGSRTNLVNCFHALLLAVLIQEGVFEVCVSGECVCGIFIKCV